MADGSLSKPGLQEYRLSGGWSQGRRLSVAELYQLRHSLPPEDQRILEATRETGEGRREFTSEAYERLIGHPRVINGSRGTTRVDVVQGVCRVETETTPATYVSWWSRPEQSSASTSSPRAKSG
jgi:hypothetical protein